MNREIKFRAWVPSKNSMMPAGPLIWWFRCAVDQNINPFDARPDVIFMQFTGLLDKNGKEIYEGDIVEIKEEYAGRGRPIEKTMQGQVVWDKEVAGFLLMNGGWQSGLGYPQGAINGSEIIGNVYENPDLMKE